MDSPLLYKTKLTRQALNKLFQGNRAKDTAKNNVPILIALWLSSIIPAREVLIKNNTHIFDKIRRTLFAVV
jgi:hypothetical protein